MFHSFFNIFLFASLASKIKTLRKRKAFSQEQLAENSSLSLRTIQRVENGETIPHGDSLRKLTQALGVNPDDILEWAPMEDKGYLIIMNLSALAFIFHPLLGVIIPVVMWILKKDKIKLVDDSGRKLISFQITWTLLLYMLLFVATGGRYINFDIKLSEWAPVFLQQFSIGGVFLAFLYLYNIALIIINTKRNNKGFKSRYIPSLPILR